MNLAVIVFVLGVGYAWMIRGMFNSLIHLLCVLFAGAIAFSFWETLALMLIEASPERGFLSFIESVAWGVSLVVPFAVVLLLLRVMTDKLISGNITNSKGIDYAGGAICGLATGIISSGVLLVGISSLRLSTDFFGYQPAWYSTERAIGAGAIVRADTLWVPVDKLTAKLYGQLSKGTLSTNEPLAKWYPELELVGFTSRISPGEGAGRNAILPADFKITSSYIVGKPDGSSSMSRLLVDAIDDRPQKYLDINSEPVSNGYIAGYVFEFEPGAKERGEKSQQLVVSNGQYRLLIEDNDGNTMSVFPIASISESSKPDQFGRWRFDASDLFITSVGGKSRVQMAFEYVVPQGYTPIAVYAKNVRVTTSSMPDAIEYANPQERDSVIRSGALLKGETATRMLDTTNMITFDPNVDREWIRTSFSLGQIMSTQVAKRGFTIDSDNKIVDGERVFDLKTEVGRDNTGYGKKLRVSKYSVSSGQKMVRVNVSAGSTIGFFSEAARDAPFDQPMLLIDEKGNEYEAIGFEYTDSKLFHVRYTRGSTLGGIEDVPTLSRSRDDQKLMILFIITNGVKITDYSIGDVGIAHFDPPLE
ncbi:MAG: CvpA family protein [Phycisphaerales bacterium]|nr:CvpA family protein [Phycisphaerales bacterium]